jgi:methyl-accepting chemotaxis protein
MMEEYAQKMAKGDLSEAISLKQDDEFGRMAEALNAAVAGFRTIIKNVKLQDSMITL